MAKKGKKVSLNRLLKAGSLFILFLIVLIGILFLNPQPGANDEEKIRNLYLRESSIDNEIETSRGFDIQISEIKVEGDWALVSIVISREEWGGRIDGSVLIYRRFLGKWFSSRNKQNVRSSWIDLAPESLIPSDAKPYLK